MQVFDFKIKVSWTTFSDVFEKHFWLVLFIMIIAISLSFYTIGHCIKDNNSFDLPTSLVTVLLSLVGLSIPDQNPRRLSLRILVITTCIGSAVILWGFQAGIVSVLTAEVIDYPIKSLQVLS